MDEKTNLHIVAIVGIIAIIGIVVVIMSGVNKPSNYFVVDDSLAADNLITDEVGQVTASSCTGGSTRPCAAANGTGTQTCVRIIIGGITYTNRWSACKLSSCNTGYNLHDGKCIIYSSCIDYDGGKNYNKSSSMLYGGLVYKDHCQLMMDTSSPTYDWVYKVPYCDSADKKCYLIEGFCPNDNPVPGTVSFSAYKCPVGCANGACITDMVCDEGSTQSCTLTHGVGTQYCVSGQWGSCGYPITSCDAGYVLNRSASSDDCVLPGVSGCIGDSTRSCLVTNGNGTQSRTCNSGNWSAWSTCRVSRCNTGYSPSVGPNITCVPNCVDGTETQPCVIDSSNGTQLRTCKNGIWSSWSSCYTCSDSDNGVYPNIYGIVISGIGGVNTYYYDMCATDTGEPCGGSGCKAVNEQYCFNNIRYSTLKRCATYCADSRCY